VIYPITDATTSQQTEKGGTTMPDLYLVAIQPNPPGRDASQGGTTTNAKLNEEWVEFEALEARNLSGDELAHLTFNSACQRTGQDAIFRFGTVQLQRGNRVRVHTGAGASQWVGITLHVYAGRPWFVWNNGCGDRAFLTYNTSVIDSAYYNAYPPEGELVRQAGTDKFVPRYRAAW
jgi:hypothetical protein